MKTNKQLEQLFRRIGSGDIDKQIEHMSDTYKDGFYNGFVKGRNTQRSEDIRVAKKLFEQWKKWY